MTPVWTRHCDAGSIAPVFSKRCHVALQIQDAILPKLATGRGRELCLASHL
ncbi:MAG: hypothetical protein KGI13_09250 [Betaproteobacteria bacterium]|nr:hypothetical protein [Betaproteobacteria bacterium]